MELSPDVSQLPSPEQRTLLRQLKPLRRSSAALARRVAAAVEQQRTEALLCNLSAADEFGIPPGASLLPHQREGVRWLLTMHNNPSVRGAVIADEMGLGKTVQVAVFLSALALRGCFGTYLVVAPLSTLENWAAELSRWAPHLHQTVYRGGKDDRAKLRGRLRKRHRTAFAQAEQLRELWVVGAEGSRVAAVGAKVGGVIIASFEAALADSGALARLLPYDALFVDEAQRLKRFDCRLIQQLRKATCQMRVVISGTPVQNTVRELWTLMEFVAPDSFLCGLENKGGGTAAHGKALEVAHVLDEWLTAQRRQRAIHRQGGKKRARTDTANESSGDDAGNGNALQEDGGVSLDDATPPAVMELITELQYVLQPHVLRRTKQSAGLALPPKVQVILPVPMTTLQKQLYEAASEAACFSNSRLMHLRRCCLHPGPLVDTLLASGDRLDPAVQALVQEAAALASTGEEEYYTALSGKLSLLAVMLPQLFEKGHRVLLFSQFTSVLDAVEGLLAETLPTVTYARLDGSTSAEERSATTAQFQATPTKTRGEGGAAGGPHGDILSLKTSNGFIGNAENGIAADDSVFSTPPPLSRRPPRSMLSTISTNAQEKAVSHMKEGKSSALYGFCQPLPQRQQTPKCTSSCSGECPSARNAATAAGPHDRKEKPFLFLISTRTGGAGLNLSAADTVILLDGDFNPHNDNQAIDRCHRIGQRRPVAVYRLVSPGTVEEEQLAVAMGKLHLERSFLQESSGRGMCSSPCAEEKPRTGKLFLCRHKGRTAHLHPFQGSPLVDRSGGSLTLQRVLDSMPRVLDRDWLVKTAQSHSSAEA